MTLAATMQTLYDNEINVALSCFWDGGWDVGLGDGINGFQERGNFDTLDEVAAWLRSVATKHYPLVKFHPTHCHHCGQKDDGAAHCAVGGCPIGGDQ